MEYLIYSLIVSLIVIQALWEVFYDKGHKTISKYIQSFWVAEWMIFAYIWQLAQPDNWWLIPISFLALWFALFDVSYNLMAGNKWNYESPTSGIYYRIMKPFKDIWLGYLLFLTICAIYGSFIILRDLKV